MIGRLRMVGVGVVCLAMVAVVPVTAQQAGGEQGPTASPLSVYTPPVCVPGVPFADVTCTTGYDPWIEQFGLDGITAGCGGGNYCPGVTVTRDQMAVFIEKAMRGTANWPPHTLLAFHHQAVEVNSDSNSGMELLSMVTGIPASGSETPSQTNPWIVKLGPGTFDIGFNTLYLPPYVSLEGSGMDETVVRGGYFDQGVVHTSSGRNTFTRLTIQSDGADFSSAVYAKNGKVVFDRARLVNTAPGGSGAPAALLALTSDVDVVNDSEILIPMAVEGFGISYGGYPNHVLQVRHSAVQGLSGAIGLTTGVEADLAYSRLDGQLLNTYGGTFKCIGNYDPNLAPVTCP